MSQNDYTPARLRELATLLGARALELIERQSRQMTATEIAAAWSSGQDATLMDRAAAALRAAADKDEQKAKICAELVKLLRSEREIFLAHIAAQEALLKRAHNMLAYLEIVPVTDARALAAEIAAALKETDNG